MFLDRLIIIEFYENVQILVIMMGTRRRGRESTTGGGRCLRVVHDCVNSSLQNRGKHGVFSFMHQVATAGVGEGVTL